MKRVKIIIANICMALRVGRTVLRWLGLEDSLGLTLRRHGERRSEKWDGVNHVLWRGG